MTTRVVELVGPAGCGKSTLARALPAADPDVRMGPTLWGLPRRMLVASAIELMPTFLGAALRGRPLKSGEMGQMVRLGALRRALARATRAGYRTILIDEGPVFGLSWLEVFHAGNGDTVRAEWRKRERAAWATRLDAVVRVDAADRQLARRIRGRAKPHMVKHLPDDGINDFTSRFRDAFDQVIADMEASGKVAVRKLPSTEGHVSYDAARLRAAIDEATRGN